MKFLETNQIQLEEKDLKKKFKKITGTRFANCLGLSPWQTAFQVWCEVTKTYEPPFTGNIYTEAGKVIESKQLAYVEKRYFKGKVVTPTMRYGKDPFKTTYGDFYPDEPIFGGMWDSLVVDGEGKTARIIECKTTKRAEDWNGDVPEYYAMQASLYAYLLGIDDVVMVASFLDEKDYPLDLGNGKFDLNPAEKFECTSDNTIIVPFKVSEKFPDFEERLKKAIDFYNNHCLTGLSPVYDKVKDKEYITPLTTNHITPDTSLDNLVNEREALVESLEEAMKPFAEKKKRLEVVEGLIKEKMNDSFQEGDKQVTYLSSKFVYKLSKSTTTGIDKKKLEKDGLLPKYQTSTEKVTFTKTEIKEGK